MAGVVGIAGVAGIAGIAGDAAGVGVICATNVGSPEPEVAVAPAIATKAIAKRTWVEETLRITSLSESIAVGGWVRSLRCEQGLATSRLPRRKLRCYNPEHADGSR